MKRNAAADDDDDFVVVYAYAILYIVENWIIIRIPKLPIWPETPTDVPGTVVHNYNMYH